MLKLLNEQEHTAKRDKMLATQREVHLARARSYPHDMVSRRYYYILAANAQRRMSDQGQRAHSVTLVTDTGSFIV